MAQDTLTSTELTIDVTCTPRNRANLRRLKTTSIQSFQRWEKENELLYAMIEDESTWLSRLFPDTFVTPELFFYALEDGTVLCLLANFIQEMAENYGARSGTCIPGKKFTFHKSKRGTRESKLFHSRENVDKFLTWCRWHGIPEAILFESNDAVMVDECRTGGREIVICLMEIARRSSRYEIEEVPQLIKLEREIDEEELSDVQRCAEEQQGLVVALDTSTVNTGTRGDRSPIDSDSGVESVFEGDPSSPRLLEFVETHQETTKEEPKNNNINKFEGENKPNKVMQKAETHSLLESSQPKTELDKKVCKIAQEYNIKIVHRLKEGKYIILGKTMFVRMLNDHLLVRIGGGWDTLDHYVMTHAQKSTGPEGIKTKTPNSERKSSGVWSKFIDKVKRRDSQPNLTDSPVVISKRERPESSPSVYRLRDRVKKKLSVTEKDEKDITAAIRKIETNLTQTGKSSSSPSFTSKTFFQLKNRFDKGRKSSRENLLEKKRKDKMADANGDMTTSEEQTKQEEIGTTSLLESETTLELKTTEASNGVTEEFSTSTTTVVSEFSSHELQFDSGKDDFPAQVTSTETNYVPKDENFLLFDQQTQQSEMQNTNDIFSHDNPALFQSETLQPEQARDTEQVEVNKDGDGESGFQIPSAADQEASKSDTAFPVDFIQEMEAKSTEISPEAEEEKPDPIALEETELTQDTKEPSVSDQTDLYPEDTEEIDSELIKASSECEEIESAPVVVLQQESDQPELNQEEQQHHIEDEEMPFEDIANNEQKDNESPAQVPSYNAAASEEQLENAHPVQMTPEEIESPETEIKDMEHVVSHEDEDIGKDDEIQVETATAPTEEEHLEDMPPVQMTPEELELPETAVKDTEHVVPEDEDIEKDEAVQVETEAETVPREEEQQEDIHPVQMTHEEDLESPVTEMKDGEVLSSQDEGRVNDGEVPVLEMGVQDRVDISNVSKELEAPEEQERLHEIVDENAQDTSIVQDTLLEKSPDVESETGTDKKETSNTVDVEKTRPETEEIPSVSPVVESATTIDEKETLVNIVDVEKTRQEPEETPALSQQIDEPKGKGDKTEKKEAKNVPLNKSAAPVDHKKLPKKTSGTTKKEHDRPASTSTSKNLTASKKDEHKAERPKGSATKPTPTKTTKPTSATNASKAKTAPAAAASKRPASAQPHKTGAATSKPATSKPAANVTSKGPTKATTRPGEPKKPSSASARPTTTKDKKPHPLSSGTQKTDSQKSRPRSAVSTKPTDKTDGKVESASGPAKTKPLSATTRTTVKKTTTTTKTSGPASKNEVSKTTTVTSKGTSSTTVKKSTESSGRTKTSKEAPSHQKPLAKNKTSDVKNGTHGKPGSASVKAKPTSATTKGKPVTGKSNPARPKSPTKGTAKKTAVAKGETIVSGAKVQETATELSATSPLSETSDTMKTVITESKDNGTITVQRTEVIENDGETKIIKTKELTTTVLENITTPDITAESKDNDTSEIHHTEVIEENGEKKIVHTQEVTETFLENGEQQTVTTETVVEESA